MKGWVLFLVVIAALVGGWWWWRRRTGQPFLPGVVRAKGGDPWQAYLDSLAATKPGELLPVPPTGSPGLTDQVADAAGKIYGEIAVKTCQAYGGGPLCEQLRGTQEWIGRNYVKAHVVAGKALVTGGKAVGGALKDAGQAVGHATVSGLKAIIPGW